MSLTSTRLNTSGLTHKFFTAVVLFAGRTNTLIEPLSV
ncbi:predicted protein [Botrytis cinerea T4]|uniref:Uncharacterized protein n=1 Tax=Botryotinia fuckeliana (strain T4) TaxID=999810 RepID=G2YMW2_BOTF4|nr:predicted protein [Botrytis cinerea T4]